MTTTDPATQDRTMSAAELRALVATAHWPRCGWDERCTRPARWRVTCGHCRTQGQLCTRHVKRLKAAVADRDTTVTCAPCGAVLTTPTLLVGQL